MTFISGRSPLKLAIAVGAKQHSGLPSIFQGRGGQQAMDVFTRLKATTNPAQKSQLRRLLRRLTRV